MVAIDSFFSFFFELLVSTGLIVLNMWRRLFPVISPGSVYGPWNVGSNPGEDTEDALVTAVPKD